MTETPMMKQYWEIKKQHPDAILFFRVGDFYEMFHDDATIASKILQITLTTRDKNKENATPLCGIPYHAASAYIHKLIKAGRSVAVCEQTEDAASAKGLVRREVARVITPGTLIEPELLFPKENNYIAAIKWDFKIPLKQAKEIGTAFLDLSTGTFQFFRSPEFQVLESVLAKIDPKEIIIPDLPSKDDAGISLPFPIRTVSPRYFLKEESLSILTKHFQVHSALALGEEGVDLIAAGALLAYLKETQKGAVSTMTQLTPYPLETFMRIHPLAQAHLNLVPKTRDENEGALLGVLDKTMTAMGGRLLRHWLLSPLLLPEKIIERQKGVAFFYDHLSLRQTLRDILHAASDMERLIGRIALSVAAPRDLIALKNTLSLLLKIETVLDLEITPTAPPVITTLKTSWDNLDDLEELIAFAILDDPPLSLKEGGVIKEGYLPELDEVRRFGREGKTILMEMEQSERKKTGIESLKIRYNQNFGYYIEVSENHLHKIPPEYIRKQTLTRAERFTTIQLKEMEDRLLGATAKTILLETTAFEAIRQQLTKETRRIQEMSVKIATLDVLISLSEAAHQNRYVCPQVNNALTIRIIEGRHPVLDTLLTTFVPNDTIIDPPMDQLLLITGPNMAGKSTYMQQVALIVLMAQIGSFVPAREAVIGVVDQIFTRIGAQDSLTKGMSTFMVEMTEMSQILRHATKQSLILLDELGRGTSTFDGVSIAWAITEYLQKQGARTLFATHYHELAQLSLSHEGIKNYHVLIRECNEEIIFLRKVIQGGCDKSYGIEVGRLAGLPAEIIQRAKAVLQQLEQADFKSPLVTDIHAKKEKRGEIDFFPAPKDPIIEKLRLMNPNAITPIQALQILYDLSDAAKG
ncbi:MAG: DNA mismatch repair protein MutS [Nitrospirota bacterium]